MNARICWPWTALLVASALAAPSWGAARGEPVLRYRPPANAPEDRPVATEITAAPAGSGYAVRLRFNRPPWGEACKNRCANATLFLDTDGDKLTGLQLGKNQAATGADLSVTVKGVREYRERSAEHLLRARVRLLTNAATSLEGGSVLAEMDPQRDPDRLQTEGSNVYVFVEATDIRIPSGRRMRIIYHPPGDKPVQLTTRGILVSGGAPSQNPFAKPRPVRSRPKKKPHR